VEPAALPPEEFAARRARVYEAIGPEAVALVQGAPAPGGFRRFRQTNEFHYLAGPAEPHAYLLLDGQRQAATLYLPHPGALGERCGVEHVAPPERLALDLAGRLWRRPALTVFTPLSPAEGAGATRDTLVLAAGRAASDPWDGAPAREARLAGHLRGRFPQVAVADLSPLLDRLRLRKSPAEVALLRAAARLCAHGLLAALAVTRVGAYEYELEAAAQAAFRRGGAQGEGYCAIVASGPNSWDGHYSANSRQLCAGDLVLMDYAPDCGYYTSDIGRMWPADGTYRPAQRELYGFMVAYHRSLLARIRPGVTAEVILGEAAAEMRQVLERTTFSKQIYAEAAARALAFDGHLSHPVGMAVHDVGDYRPDPLVPGLVFSVDPQLWVPEERLYVRVEDTVAVTADGCENLTGTVPQDPEALERQMQGAAGLSPTHIRLESSPIK